MDENSHSVENEKIAERAENSVKLEFTIPAESDFFDGHFPEFKLLPAVAQFEIVTRFAKKYLGTERAVTKINRIKFSAPIRPGAVCALSMERNSAKNSVTYSLCDANSKKAYSSGTFLADSAESPAK